MTVTFIKRECYRHPGCFTISGKCDRCVDEDLRAEMERFWANVQKDLVRAVGGDQ